MYSWLAESMEGGRVGGNSSPPHSSRGGAWQSRGWSSQWPSDVFLRWLSPMMGNGSLSNVAPPSTVIGDRLDFTDKCIVVLLLGSMAGMFFHIHIGSPCQIVQVLVVSGPQPEVGNEADSKWDLPNACGWAGTWPSPSQAGLGGAAQVEVAAGLAGAAMGAEQAVFNWTSGSPFYLIDEGLGSAYTLFDVTSGLVQVVGWRVGSVRSIRFCSCHSAASCHLWCPLSAALFLFSSICLSQLSGR